MLKIALVFLGVLVVALGVVLLLGAQRWHTETQELRRRLEATRVPLQPQTVMFRELLGLPAPVQRFLRAVLREGQPMVAAVRVRHRGTFNLGETTDQWKPFMSEQNIVTQRPGFDWAGRIVMLPGLPVRVHDAYIAGEGLLHASWLGLFSLVNIRGTDDMATGELIRFLAEAAWYPTVLLPSQGVHWEAVDTHSATATLTDGRRAVTLRFAFNASGLIETVRAEARGRMVGGTMVQTAWQGRFWHYDERHGMRIPLEGEVAWLLPAGAMPYWRGHIMEIAYEFTP